MDGTTTTAKQAPATTAKQAPGITSEALLAALAPPPAPPPPSPKKTPVWIYIAGGTGVLVVFLIFLALLTNGQDEEGAEQPYIPGTPCRSEGTDYYDEDMNTCVCKAPYTGAACDACQPGWGPEFPCCERQLMPWSNYSFDVPVDKQDLTAAGLQNYCITNTCYTGGTSGKRDTCRACWTEYPGCNPTPTWTGGNTSGLNAGYYCEPWIDMHSGKFLAYRENTGADNWRTILATKKEAKSIRPAKIWCDPFPSIVGASPNNISFRNNCVVEGQYTCSALESNSWRSQQIPVTAEDIEYG